MLLTEVILRLRKQCPLFGQRVAGTQWFAAATNTDTDIDVPSCFVVPMSETAKEPDAGSGGPQLVTERFATIVVADNSKDARYGRGLSADTILRQGRNELLAALLGWSPLSMMFVNDVQFARGQHLFMNNARIWHQYEWTASYYVRACSEGNPTYEAIEKIINGYYPEVDASKVRLVASNTANFERKIHPNDPGSYDVIFQALEDTPPDWIRYKSHVEDPGLQNQDPGDALYSGTRKVERP